MDMIHDEIRIRYSTQEKSTIDQAVANGVLSHIRGISEAEITLPDPFGVVEISGEWRRIACARDLLEIVVGQRKTHMIRTTIAVNTNEVALLIGTRGRTRSAIKLETGANILIPTWQHTPMTNVEIYALTQHQVDYAGELINRALNRTLFPILSAGSIAEQDLVIDEEVGKELLGSILEDVSR